MGMLHTQPPRAESEMVRRETIALVALGKLLLFFLVSVLSPEISSAGRKHVGGPTPHPRPPLQAAMLMHAAMHTGHRATPALSRSAPAALVFNSKSAGELGAAALLLGTAIGGGFLATPHATAPAGALPSAAVLSACWLVLLIEALVISDLVISDHEQTGSTSSFASLGRRAFGDLGGAAISATFAVLMMATLVSQLSKGATLFPPIGPTPVRIALLAAALAAFASGAPLQAVSLANGVLTIGFVAAAAVLCKEALPLATWARLSRANWAYCWKSAPTLLQLHVYAEIVPSICESLGHDRIRVRRALVVGSLMLLGVQVSWATLGVAAVPFAAGALRADPIDAILGSGGRLAAATTLAGATAVSTTILGTARALHTFCADAVRQSDGAALSPRRATLGRALFVALIGLPVILACRASASAAFFGAIDFAGAYPVALLWGVAPPLMCLRLRGARLSRRSRAGLVGLAALAASFVAGNVVSDMGGVARWQ